MVAQIISDTMLTAVVANSEKTKPHRKQLDLVIQASGGVPSAQTARFTFYNGYDGRGRSKGPLSPTFYTPYPTAKAYVPPKPEPEKAQIEEVRKVITAAQWIPESKVDDQIEWFYNKLGIDDEYFQKESAEVISNHIASLYAAKVAAVAREGTRDAIGLDMEAADHAIYIDTSEPGKGRSYRYEERLESKYLDGTIVNKRFRVEAFCSPNNLTDRPASTMRCYFVYQCKFADPNPYNPQETRLKVIGDKMFLAKANLTTQKIYQDIMDQAICQTGPVIKTFDVESASEPEKRLVIAFRQRTAPGIFSALSDLYHHYDVISPKKYVDQFSNGMTIISMNLKLKVNTNQTFQKKYELIEHSCQQISKEISLLYCIPRNNFQPLFASGRLSLQETIYAHCVWVFVQHFLDRLGPEYTSLVSVMDPKNNEHADILSKIKRRLRTETFTADYIGEIISRYPELVQQLYARFADVHYKQNYEKQDGFSVITPSPSVDTLSDAQLKEYISRTVGNEHEQMVWDGFLLFNSVVLKTNFYVPTKLALSFRLDPKFLRELELEYPQALFGMFLVISGEFRGFHLRFRDIARGGIRIVKSRNREAYAINVRSMFDENYGLANTQQSKNKDIPEGGSKGVILLDAHQQDKGSVAFEKYIDSIIDLLLPQENPIVDLYGKQEILFMGPDENTADLVDWATEHARKRGAKWWKSFFTGKSPKLGGIPHDAYGMTTLSVREYVKGIYEKLNLDPTTVRKMQTGGPDGDLGSNEILLSNEKYTAIIDGSGVLVDPNGINREELVRLAKKRFMISEFDTSKLSKDGYRVLVDEKDVSIPGEAVRCGMTFRNTFHLRDIEVDTFVPCGGRPASIDLSNVSKLIKNGKCTVSYIVEGANLFITQEAKLRLEAAGCIIYKDASANKGGVTSSSLEVLASLSFDDDGFVQNMCCGGPDGRVPDFYQAYVREVQDIIRNNARLEFEAIWREHEETGIARSVLSDALSAKITSLDEELQSTSELWNNEDLRRAVLKDALPKLLLEKIGLDLIIRRVPDNYLKSIFGSYLASRFVYEYGSSPSQFAFFDFMSKKMNTIMPPPVYSLPPLSRSGTSTPMSLASSTPLPLEMVNSRQGRRRTWVVGPGAHDGLDFRSRSGSGSGNGSGAEDWAAASCEVVPFGDGGKDNSKWVQPQFVLLCRAFNFML